MHRLPVWHTSLAFCAYFTALGVHLPFWPLWLRDWGLSEAEVGAFGAFGVAARMVAGFGIPILADRLDQRRLIAAIATLLAAVFFFAHGFAGTRGGLLALTLLATGCLLGAMPLLETLGAVAARRHNFDFARSRAAGSAAFLIASILGGWLIAHVGIDLARWWVLIALTLAAALMLRHPGGGEPLNRPGFGQILALFTQARVFWLSVTVAAAQSSHGILYIYGSIHWRALGYSEAAIGWLWALGVLAEVLLMAFIGRRLVGWLTAEGALMLAAAVGVFRWCAMALDPVGLPLIGLQILHAITFALAHLGMMAWVTERLEAHLAASALALSNALVGGALTAGVMLASAALYPTWGGAAYLLAAALSALSLVGSVFLLRYRPSAR